MRCPEWTNNTICWCHTYIRFQRLFCAVWGGVSCVCAGIAVGGDDQCEDPGAPRHKWRTEQVFLDLRFRQRQCPSPRAEVEHCLERMRRPRQLVPGRKGDVRCARCRRPWPKTATTCREDAHLELQITHSYKITQNYTSIHRGSGRATHSTRDGTRACPPPPHTHTHKVVTGAPLLTQAPT